MIRHPALELAHDEAEQRVAPGRLRKCARTSLLKRLLAQVSDFTVLALIVGYAVPFFVAILLNELRHAKGYLRCLVYLPVMLPPTSALLLFAYFYDPSYGLFNDVLRHLHLPVSQWVQSPGTGLPSMAMISVVIESWRARFMTRESVLISSSALSVAAFIARRRAALP